MVRRSPLPADRTATDRPRAGRIGIFLPGLLAMALWASACGDDPPADTTVAPAAVAPDASVTEPTEPGEDIAASEDDLPEEDAVLPGRGVPVTIARANWSTGYMQAAIYAALLSELGYEVNHPADLELAPSNAYVSMANGEFDLWPNSWFPNHDHFFKGEMPDGTLVEDHITPIGWEMRSGAIQGFVTNKTLAEEHDIRTLDQILNDPELFAMFDAADSTPDDGVLQLLGCPEGWGCYDNIKSIIEDIGWTNVEQLEVASYDILITEAMSRDAAGDPYVALTWGPSAYVIDLRPGDNVVWLSIADEYHSATQTRGPATLDAGHCSARRCNLGWDLADIRVTANNDFLAANPPAARLLELVMINPVDVALQSVKYQLGENTDGDVHRHAAAWIEANRETVDRWLAEAAAAA